MMRQQMRIRHLERRLAPEKAAPSPPIMDAEHLAYCTQALAMINEYFDFPDFKIQTGDAHEILNALATTAMVIRYRPTDRQRLHSLSDPRLDFFRELVERERDHDAA